MVSKRSKRGLSCNSLMEYLTIERDPPYKFKQKAKSHSYRRLTWYKEKIKITTHCIYCKILLTWQNRTADHIVPRAKGGKNSEENIRIICRPCNITKSNLTHEQMEYLVRNNDA